MDLCDKDEYEVFMEELRMILAWSQLADCPAMSFVFVCWQKYKSVELGDQLVLNWVNTDSLCSSPVNNAKQHILHPFYDRKLISNIPYCVSHCITESTNISRLRLYLFVFVFVFVLIWLLTGRLNMPHDDDQKCKEYQRWVSLITMPSG